jgi:hypothetical protein
MNRFHGSLTDEIWHELKGWARAHARSNALASRRMCSARVIQIVKELTGRSDALPAQAVQFYAMETLAMIDRFRQTQTEPADLETAI